MTRYVVDASVAVKWVTLEVQSEEARRILRSENELFAPQLLIAEAANILWKKSLAGELTESESRAALSQMLRPIQFRGHESVADAALSLAIRHRRTAYDSIYVTLAMELGARFVTADGKLYSALRSSYPEAFLWIEDVPE